MLNFRQFGSLWAGNGVSFEADILSLWPRRGARVESSENIASLTACSAITASLVKKHPAGG